MIHQLIFAAPKPGMTERQFQDYWIDVHAVRYASKIPQIRRYAVDRRLELPDDGGEPLWSGVGEIWLRNAEEQLASLQTPEFLDGARADEPRWAAFWRTVVLDTDAHVLVEGPPQRADQHEAKLFVLVKRKQGISLDDFRRRALRTRSATSIPGLVRYVQGHSRDGMYGVGEAPLDAAFQLHFAGPEALVDARNTAEYRAFESELREFVEPRYVHTLAVEQNWVIGPEAR
ncbi:EthD domain-containing protein [Saccharopolyspora erythraea]|uniref:EthD domain-containing protein n=1 Tax=Saccharopolyspora erythraea TaxID=1836 RepID=UPI001BAA24E9|nr:EthD domain-containing protein [Saccharopolyspora erythraea]QUH02164.1 EthD domain-containing protein [Saccharopolyspora erythraea]